MWMPAPDAARALVYRKVGYWTDDTIVGLIAKSVSTRGDHIAIDDGRRVLTYQQLWEQSAAFAGCLRARNVAAGAMVTICLPNWWEFVVATLGALRLGAIVNPVPPSYGRADLAHIVQTCQSAAVIYASDFRSVAAKSFMPEVAAAAASRPYLIEVGTGSGDISFDQALSSPAFDAIHDSSADDPATILFTSGTESKPKGVVHTHNTILFGERAFAHALSIGFDDVAFMATPIAHTTGFMHGVVMTLVTGGTLVLLDVFSGENAVSRMRSTGTTWTMGATPFLADTVDVLDRLNDEISTLRFFLCGGAPVPEALVRRADAIGIRALPVYGSTESPPHTVGSPTAPIDTVWSTDGRPLPGIEVRIAAPDGSPLEPGEVGEEWSRGPNTFLGYLDNPDLSRRDLDADGWYHSGDLARLLPDGAVRIAGRIKEIIVRGGQNISVREVEDYLSAHDAIAKVAIVGIPHSRLGETACAAIVLRPGRSVDLPAIASFLTERGVAKFKFPERLIIFSSLPTTPSGKVQKYLIRKAVVETLSAESA